MVTSTEPSARVAALRMSRAKEVRVRLCMDNEKKTSITRVMGRNPFKPTSSPPLPPSQARYAPIGISLEGVPGTLDLNKVASYFTFPGRDTYTQLSLEKIRTRFEEGHFWHPPTLENLVEALFENTAST